MVDYFDQAGKRHLKSFDRKKEAENYSATARVEVREGTHTADSTSVTVATAGRFWIATAEQNGLERSTVDSYRQTLDLDIVPAIGTMKLSQLTAPVVREFEDKLGASPAPRSTAMRRKILGSLGAILADAQERGLVVRNVVRELRGRRRPGKERRADKRQKGRLKVGVDIPSPTEVKAFVGALEGRWRTILLTAVFTGLRASDLRAAAAWSPGRGEARLRPGTEPALQHLGRRTLMPQPCGDALAELVTLSTDRHGRPPRVPARPFGNGSMIAPHPPSVPTRRESLSMEIVLIEGIARPW